MGRTRLDLPGPIMEFVSATPNFIVLNTEGNWLLQELEADGMPAHKLPIESKSKDITGAFPLSHAQTYVWEQGNVLDDPDQEALRFLARSLRRG